MTGARRTAAWTTPQDIRAKVRRRWDDGSLLRSYAADEPFALIDLPIRGPRASQIGDDLGAVQRWITALVAGQRGETHYELEFSSVGGRVIGRNEIPTRAQMTTYAQTWRLLGVSAEIARLDRILAQTQPEPVVWSWVVAHPLKALAFDGEWDALLAAYRWLDAHRGSGRYLREIDAPGVDTKLVERHRSMLATMLGAPTTAAGFLAALGLAGKAATVRLRFDHGFAGLPDSMTEATFRLDEVSALAVAVEHAVIVENEVTFLTLPVPPAGVVLWGKGFDVDRAGSLPWLREARVHYWGDLDTHGFAILDRLRAWLPQTRSFLMDHETLLQHRERWVRESSPTRARLGRLSAAEFAVYDDLVTDQYGDGVRLEQERIAWDWVLDALPWT